MGEVSTYTRPRQGTQAANRRRWGHKETGLEYKLQQIIDGALHDLSRLAVFRTSALFRREAFRSRGRRY